jgi:hypothetical protein
MRGMRSPYPRGPYQRAAWGPAPAPSSQLVGTIGESLHDSLDNLLSIVEQSVSLMSPMTVPTSFGGPMSLGGPMIPGGPWGRRRPGRWRHWDDEGGHGPGCGCGGAHGKWQEGGEDDCGCGERHGHHKHHRHHRHERDCGCGDHRERDCGCGDRHEPGCGCHQCGDDCHCFCCVTGADLVVEARLGELRVVTVEVVNERRRERDITLELGSFTTRGGGPSPVIGLIEGETTFQLGPCSEHLVTIVLEVGTLREAPRDVDDCLVAWADLKVEGCDVRPVRIAVAILPRDCGPYRVRCACGCCC